MITTTSENTRMRIDRLQSYLSLCKPRISFFASLSAMAGLLLAARSFAAPWASLMGGVFLLAGGASALNNYQERHADALMARTAFRPLPAGRIKSGHALFWAAAWLVAGCLVLMGTGSLMVLLLGLTAVLWYNGFYTPLKARMAFAPIPGALVGAIPPAMGWVAGGGSLGDPRLAALSFFFFLWQVPHFFVHFLVFGKEYEACGLPSLTSVFTTAQLDRLTCQWLLATAVALQLVVFQGLARTLPIRIALLAASVGLIVQGTGLVRHHHRRYKRVFQMSIYFILLVMLLFFLDMTPGQ